MRDLAQQNLITRKKKLLYTPAVKFFLIVVGIILVLVFVKSKTATSTSSGVSGGSVVLRDAPKNLTPVSLESSNLEVSDGGVNLSSDSATLSDVGGVGGKGTARRTYGGGGYSLSVSATLPDPKGNRYQVWISDGSDVVDAGFMSGSKTSWSQIFRDSGNFSGYNEVWVTQEITTEDGKPEKHVLEGSF